jgi:hypothetical protein
MSHFSTSVARATLESTELHRVDIVVAAGGLILWLTLLIFQLADLGASVLDVRNARGSAAVDHQSRRRFADYFWSLPLGAALGLGVILGVDFAGRQIFVVGEPVKGLIVLLALTAVILFVGIGIIVALTKVELTYASIAAALEGTEGARLSKRQVEAFRAQLASVDARRKDLGSLPLDLRTRGTYRGELDRLVREFRGGLPRGLAAFDAIRLPVATRYLWSASLWRLIPVLVGLVPLVAVLVGAGSSFFGPVPVAVLLAIPALLSYLLAAFSAKAALAAKVSWRAIEENQRVAVEQHLANAERISRKGIAGLGERVTRALQILREQQR